MRKGELVALKKQIKVKAWQFNGSLNFPSWLAGRAAWRSGKLVISTPEGEMTAEQGDYIVRGAEGEVYPVKKRVFEKSYEVLRDDTRKQPVSSASVMVVEMHFRVPVLVQSSGGFAEAEDLLFGQRAKAGSEADALWRLEHVIQKLFEQVRSDGARLRPVREDEHEQG